MIDKVIMSSSQKDSDGDIISKEALIDMANSMNNDRRKIAVNIEHDMTVPPMGIVLNAEVIKAKDEIFCLAGEIHYYNQKELIKSIDDQLYIKECFKENKYPLRMFDLHEQEDLVIEVDPNSFETKNGSSIFFEEIRNGTDINFKDAYKLRKSELPDPIIIFKLSSQLAVYYLGGKLIYKFLEKIVEKLGDNVGDELIKFIDLVKKSSIKMIKYAKPKNRPVVYVMEIHSNILIQFVIKTDRPETLINAISKDNFSQISEKIEILINQFNAEQIQFLYKEKEGWVFNYLITINGETIGTFKTYDRRKYLLKKLENNEIQNISFEGKIS